MPKCEFHRVAMVRADDVLTYLEYPLSMLIASDERIDEMKRQKHGNLILISNWDLQITVSTFEGNIFERKTLRFVSQDDFFRIIGKN